MDDLLVVLLGCVIWQLVKYIYKTYKRGKHAGFRVHFEATVSSMDESHHLLEHILRVPVPEDGGFVMYDVNYKVMR